MISAAANTALSAGGHGVYLVTVRAGGIVIRAATQAADVPWATGHDLAYAALARLEPLALEVNVGSLTGIGAYESIKVEIADESTDAVSLQLAGHPLAGAVVEIALWWPGQDWELREVVLRGRARSPTLSPAGRLTGFTATSQPASSGSAGVVDPDVGITDEFPSRPYAVELAGNLFPVVLGRVRNIPGLKLGGWSSVDHLLLAGHWLGAGDVNAYEDASTTPFAINPYTIVNTYSDEGRKVAWLEGAALSTFIAAGALTVNLETGGAPRRDGAGATRTAADVLVWLLTKSERRVDWRRCQQALVHLATWDLGIYLDAESPAVNVIADRIVKVLPLVVLESADGLWYHYVDLSLNHPTADLVEGQNLLGPVPGTALDWGSEEDCRNAYSLDWYYDHAVDQMRQHTAIDHDSDPMCRLGLDLTEEVRAEEPVDADMLWTETTARRSLLHRARRKSLPFGTCRMVVSADVAVDLRPGATVLLTWSAWGLSRRPVVVRQTHPAGDIAEVVLTVAPSTALRNGSL